MTTYYRLNNGKKISLFYHSDEYILGGRIYHDIAEVVEYDEDDNLIKVKSIKYPGELVPKTNETKVYQNADGVPYILWKGERINLENYEHYDIPTLVRKLEKAVELKDRWYVSQDMILATLMKHPNEWGVILPPRYCNFRIPGTSIGITGNADEDNPIPFVPVEVEMRKKEHWFYKIHFEVQDPDMRQYTASEDFYFSDFVSMLVSGHLKFFQRQTAYNIDWDVDEYTDLEYLPEEIEIPGNITDPEEISDLITELTGFCHKGFQLK